MKLVWQHEIGLRGISDNRTGILGLNKTDKPAVL
jgi:hypothetical protein